MTLLCIHTLYILSCVMSFLVFALAGWTRIGWRYLKRYYNSKWLHEIIMINSLLYSCSYFISLNLWNYLPHNLIDVIRSFINGYIYYFFYTFVFMLGVGWWSRSICIEVMAVIDLWNRSKTFRDCEKLLKCPIAGFSLWFSDQPCSLFILSIIIINNDLLFFFLYNFYLDFFFLTLLI